VRVIDVPSAGCEKLRGGKINSSLPPHTFWQYFFTGYILIYSSWEIKMNRIGRLDQERKWLIEINSQNLSTVS
jgi:hypothetical protein